MFKGIEAVLRVGLPCSLSSICVICTSQTMRDVGASHNELIKLFERIHLFLQRLNIYIKTPLKNELTEFLGKIMAQLLSILALSTKAVTDSPSS